MSRPLRVGLDLVPLGDAAGGIGRYAAELLRALAEHHAGRIELHGFVSRDGAERWRAVPGAGRVRWTTLPVRLSGPPLHLLASYAAIPALALARRLDVLHAPANAGAVRVPGVACVVTLHDVIWRHAGEDWGPPAALRAMERVTVPVVRRADRVLADSHAAARDIAAELGLAPGSLDVVPLGVRPPDPARPRTPEPELRARMALGGGPVLLCVAQKRRYKRQDVAVRALAALGAPEVRLVLPGAPTPWEDELRSLAASLGVAGQVAFPAYVSEADLEGLYGLAAGFVLASEHEGFGLPVLEAMARGVPVACSARSALAEVAGDAALTFDPGRQEEADAAVARLLGEPGLARELAAAGLRRAAAWTWEATAAGTVAAYERALAARR
jgi:glycosyltransferase involved in cell wall biosynthesis